MRMRTRRDLVSRPPFLLEREREAVMIVMANVWLQRMVAVISMAVVISKGLWMGQLRVEDRKRANGLLIS